MTDETRHTPAKAATRTIRITSNRGRVYDTTFDRAGSVINVTAVSRPGRYDEKRRLNWGNGSGRPMSELTKAITRIAARLLNTSHRPEDS